MKIKKGKLFKLGFPQINNFKTKTIKFKMSELNSTQSMQLAVKKFDHHLPLMEDKTTKAMAALSKIKTIKNDDDDKAAAHILSRVRPTFELVQQMRKEITDPLDQIKKALMEHEKKISNSKGSGSEYERVKKLRDQYANKRAAEAKAEQEKIETQRRKKLEIASIKSNLVKSIESGVYDLIKEGEIALTKFVSSITLENFDEKVNQLNYKPKLKTDAFNKLMTVQYDKSLVSVAEYQELLKSGGEQFSYDHINGAYYEHAINVLDRFKNEVIPARKQELEEIAKSSADEQKVKRQQEEQLLEDRLKEIDDAYENEKKSLEEKTDDEAADSMIDAEFESQVGIQSIKEQKDIRKNITYRIDEQILAKPAKIVDVLIKIITHVMIDEKFKGVIKRDSQGYPRVDDDGKTEFVDGVSFWLKELSKLKIDIDIENLIKTENVTTIVKSSKE